MRPEFRHARAALAPLAIALLLGVPRAGVSEDADRPLPPIVFVSRHPVLAEDGTPEPGAIPGIGPRDRAAAVGGRLLVREPGGALRVLVDGTWLFDVADPCVSWDGTRVAFSGLTHSDSSWRIWEIRADGSGLRPLTRSDRAVSLVQFGAAAARFARYDDVDPCWLPDGRICFASTRYPLVAQIGDLPATNLFVVGEDGHGPHRITSERNGADEPVVDPATGRVVYAHWLLNLDRPSNVTRSGLTFLDHEALTRDIGNIWEAVSVTPDGRGMTLHAGDPRTRAGLLCYKPTPLPDGRVLTLFAANPALAPTPVATGVRLFGRGASEGRAVLGLKPGPGLGAWASGDPEPLLSAPRAADPVALPDGRLLVAWAPDARGDFGLYRCRLDGSELERVLDLPGTHELDAAVLAPQPVPPVIPDQLEPAAPLPPTEDPETFVRGGTFRFDCLNVFANAPVDAPVPDAPAIAQGARVRLYLNFQRQHPGGRDPSILYREAALTPRGAIHENEIPADVPLFDQLVDAHGRVLSTTSGAFAHLAGFGSGRRSGWAQCVGCHAGHSTQFIPHNFSAAEWFNVSTSAVVEASSEWRPHRRGEPPCPARRVVDRRARSDSLGVAWVAAGRRGQSVTLTWPIPIEVSRFVLYGIRPDPPRGTDLVVERCRITLLRGGHVVGRVNRTGAIAPEGTVIAAPSVTIDAAKIELLEVRGRVAGRPLAGLAEVETIARLALE